jgi:uncharacterized protein YcfJ
MRMPMRTLLGVAIIGLATHAAAQITFYEGDGFRGRAFTIDGTIFNFDKTGFNDRAQSAVVGGGAWEVCEHADFQGRCMILRPGNYDSLDGIGMARRISSARPVAGGVAAPVAAPVYSPPPERLYEAQVTSVRAVGGPPEQRCWVERQQVHESSGPNIPGAIVGGVIGGVLGHQIGGGRGKDVATAGGAVAGAAIGANVGRDSGVSERDVQRCADVSSSFQPAYWDVTYIFQGVERRAQLNAPPAGPTITVNGYGEPRG